MKVLSILLFVGGLILMTNTSVYGQSFPTDPRSDSMDILHISINLNISDFIDKSINGHTELTIHPKMNNIDHLSFDLLELNIDSILVNQVKHSFSYNDTLIQLPLQSVFQKTDTFTVTIWYQGQPGLDPTGWGGFYFTGNYAFNLGVGFGADPHNYGRAWFPCLDNFTERSTYSFHITTRAMHRAMCNGTLMDSTLLPGSKIEWYWEMHDPIASYLASVTISDYTTVNWTYNGLEGTVPIVLAARPSDTNNIKQSFSNLPKALEIFEKSYGAHSFERVGFCFVPFNGGAMEHATNITYPLFGANGTKNFETLMAHELSHHWWGDLMTCKTAEDMWLNEGWASYSEYLFLEFVYGKDRYRDGIRGNHNEVLHKAHIDDEEYLPLSGVPHAHTYGSHSYDKGADVAHTMRGYLNDTVFFDCITAFLDSFSFENADSHDFKDFMSGCAGPLMDGFFDGWVLQEGFPHFSIDSFKTIPLGNEFLIDVYIRQRLYEAPNYYSDIPLEIIAMDNSGNRAETSFIMDGRCGIYRLKLDFEPEFVALDMNERISDAISDDWQVFKGENFTIQLDAFFTLNYVKVPDGDSLLIRVEHNWVAPDPFKQPVSGLHLSNRRYWKVDGLIPDQSIINANIKYNGSTTNAGYLDNFLISNVEDSLILLYRERPGEEWAEFPNYILNTLGSNTNKSGIIDIIGLEKGEYTLAIYDASRSDSIISDIPNQCVRINPGVGISEPHIPRQLTIIPNPANEEIRFDFDHPHSVQIEILDFNGKVVMVKPSNQSFSELININRLQGGIYLVRILDAKKVLAIGKFIVSE